MPGFFNTRDISVSEKKNQKLFFTSIEGERNPIRAGSYREKFEPFPKRKKNITFLPEKLKGEDEE